MRLASFGDPAFVWKAAITALVLALALGDLRKRTIPRHLTVPAVIVGIAYHAWFGGWYGAIGAAFVGFCVGLLLFSLGALGGGDAKLLTALGAMLGWSLWLRAMSFTLLFAGVMGLVQALAANRLREMLENIRELTLWLIRRREAHPLLQVNNPNMIRSPFAVAVAVGSLVALWTYWSLW